MFPVLWKADWGLCSPNLGLVFTVKYYITIPLALYFMLVKHGSTMYIVPF